MTQQEMFDMHYQSVCRIANSFIIPGYSPEDLQQEASLILLEKIKHPEAAKAGFIAISVRNKLIDLKRRANFLDLSSLDAPVSNDEDCALTLGDTIADNCPSPEDRFFEAEFEATVEKAVASLPDLDGKVVRIHIGMNQTDGLGKSLRQTAKVLSITPDRAERAWKRSLQSLRDNEYLMEAA